jgi:adenylosuccinate lyase
MSCPVYSRYATKEMLSIFSEEAKIERWLKVEATLARAQAELGMIPKEAAEEIAKKANLKFVKIERIKEIEKEIDHDLLAVVNALAEVCEKDYGRFVHKGATSYDIEDTAWALAFKDALNLIKKKLEELLAILLRRARENIDLVCIGRTHGQHALPTTYGMKFALWSYDIYRILQRLDFFLELDILGKMSGAVGTMAAFDEKGIELQSKVMELLGIKPALISNQVVQRDAFADIIYLVALTSSCLEKIAKEIRNLQRTEIAEVMEPFHTKQAGSSTMPHKRNPHRSERICSLARYQRALVQVALENISLEHERDLTNSANERIMLSHSFMLLDFMLKEMIEIISGLEINYTNVKKNLELLNGIYMAERVMLKLVEKGLSRNVAYNLVKDLAIKSYQENLNFAEELANNEIIRNYLTQQEIKDLLNPYTYIGQAKKIVENVISEIEKKLKN